MNDRASYTSSEDAREAERAVIEADARAQTEDYVEARRMLIPAVDYFVRAVDAANGEGRLTGELLSEVSSTAQTELPPRTINTVTNGSTQAAEANMVRILLHDGLCYASARLLLFSTPYQFSFLTICRI
jgi:hypothetical protein